MREMACLQVAEARPEAVRIAVSRREGGHWVTPCWADGADNRVDEVQPPGGLPALILS